MPAGYRLQVSPTNLMLVVANTSSLALTPLHLQVRSIVGGSQTGTATLTNGDGSYDATFNTSVTSNAAATPSTGSVTLGGGTTNVAIGFSDYSATGARTGTVTFSNTANSSDSFNTSGFNVFTLDSGSAVVANRTVTASSVNLGAVHVGGTGSGMSSLSTSGDDNHFTRVTVNATSFNSASSTGSYNLSQMFSSTGATSGSTTLTTTGEGLTGETAINVNVAYTAQVFSGQQAWNPSFTSGGWSTDADWTDLSSNAGAGSPGLAGSLSAGDTATFDNAAAATMISLGSASPHVAAITLANTNTSGFAYTIAGGGSGVLHLDNGGGTASITASSAGQSITAPIALDSNLSVTVATDTLALNGAISGTNRTLTKLGAGTLSLGSTNSYSGGTTASAGTLRTTADNALGGVGSGPLLVNAAVNLGGNEISGTLGGLSSGSLSVAATKTLAVNQAADGTLAGSLTLGTTNSGATLAVSSSASKKLTLMGPTTLNTGNAITVNGNATLNLNLASANTQVVGTGVTVTVADSASLELAGSVSALMDANTSVRRASITNSSTAAAGIRVPDGAVQQVGGIDGSGNVVVADTTGMTATSLTADHINQTSLVIGAGSIFTLAPSDSNGNPMAAAMATLSPGPAAPGSATPASSPSSLLADSLTSSSSFLASSGSLLSLGSASSVRRRSRSAAA